MKKFAKRAVGIITAATLIIGTNVSAAWNFAGYDTTNPPEYGKIYNEVIDGSYTSNHKIEPVDAKDVEWKFESYDAAYPHAGYERLYLEGNRQNGVTRYVNLYPQWDTRFRDFMWEVCGAHRIYERQQTKINNKYWAWDFGNDALGVPDSDVFVPTNRFAETTDSFKPVGVANLDVNGNYVFDVNGTVYPDKEGKVKKVFTNEELIKIYNGPFDDAMPNAFDVVVDENGIPTKNITPGTFFSIENLSQIDVNTGKHIVTDEMIAAQIDIPQTKYTTGPSYYGENPTKNVAKMYAEIGDKWEWDRDVAIVTNDAEISWSKPQYEMAEPYLYYEYLIVNGLVFDGRNDTPIIKRYTGGKANPKVEWRYCFAEENWPYEVIEVKFMEGNSGKMIMAVDENGAPIVRIPTGEFANSYFVVTDTEVQLWIKDDVKDYMIYSESRNDGPFGDDYAGYTNGGVYIYNK